MKCSEHDTKHRKVLGIRRKGQSRKQQIVVS